MTFKSCPPCGFSYLLWLSSLQHSSFHPWPVSCHFFFISQPAHILFQLAHKPQLQLSSGGAGPLNLLNTRDFHWSILLATLLPSPLPTQLANMHMLGPDPLTFCFSMLTSHHHQLFTCQCSQTAKLAPWECWGCSSVLPIYFFYFRVLCARWDRTHGAHSCAGWYLAQSASL